MNRTETWAALAHLRGLADTDTRQMLRHVRDLPESSIRQLLAASLIDPAGAIT